MENETSGAASDDIYSHSWRRLMVGESVTERDRAGEFETVRSHAMLFEYEEERRRVPRNCREPAAQTTYLEHLD
jgi:hypothetical protein